MVGGILVWIPVSLVLATKIPTILHFRLLPAGVLVPLSFVVLVWVGLLVTHTTARLDIRRCAIAVLFGLLSFWVLAGVLASRWTIDANAISVFVGALAEEVVFRVLAPYAIFRCLGHERRHWHAVFAVLIAQCSFTASHFTIHHFLYRATFPEIGRLLASGILFWIIVYELGVWAAASIHGVLDLSAVSAMYYLMKPTGLLVAVVLLGSIITVAMIARNCPTLGLRGTHENRILYEEVA